MHRSIFLTVEDLFYFLEVRFIMYFYYSKSFQLYLLHASLLPSIHDGVSVILDPAFDAGIGMV